MDTTPIVSDRSTAAGRASIYEPRGAVATERVEHGSKPLRAGFGAILGIATWLLFITMGIPYVFRISEYDGLAPFAVIGALAGLTRLRKVLWVPAAMMTILLMVVAYTDLIEAPVRSLIRRDAVPQSANAIVVLSAGINPDGLLGWQATDRIIKGIELVQAGVAPTIVTTRERNIFRGKVITSEQDQKRLLALGGVTDALVTPVINNTREEAVAVERIARARGWSRVVLVTSPAHSGRACATFEKVGLTVSCVPSESRDVAFNVLGNGEDRIAALRLLVYERAGTVLYRWKGWL